METQTFRPGSCQSCGAQYRLPSAYAHDKAKCKACGGVVEIGSPQTVPVQPTAERPPAPREPAPARSGERPARDPDSELEEVTSFGGGSKRRSGPSMMEQLRSRRAAAEPESRPVPARRPAKAEVREEAEEESKPKPARGASGSKRGARPGAAARRRRGGSDDDGEGGARARRGRGSARGSSVRGGRGLAKKKQSPVAAIAGVGGLIVIAALGMFLFREKLFGDGVEAAGDGDAAEAPAEGAPPAEPAAGDGAPAEEPPAEESADDGGAGAADDDETAAAEEEADAASGAEAEIEEWLAKDLAAELPEFGPVDDTTEEEWQTLQDEVAVFLDRSAGKRSVNARAGLQEAGRKAFPALLNELKRVDLTSHEGNLVGNQCQRLLMDICNGNNFGWKDGTSDRDVVYNKKVVRQWAVQWERSVDDLAYWAELSKQDPEDVGAEGAEGAGEEEDGGGGLDFSELDSDD